MNLRVRRLDRVEDVRRLEGLLGEYIHFVTDSWVRDFSVTVDPDRLLSSTLSHLDQVVPPHGVTLIAEAPEGTLFGMAFLRPSGPSAMEIKRLYVPPEGRGKGTGRALVEAAIETAAGSGAAALRLDTTKNLDAAIALYRSYGFEDCAPYRESDHFDDPVLGPHLLFMEKRL